MQAVDTFIARGEIFMAETITATYRDGAFVPDEPVNVAAGTRVRLTVENVVQQVVAQKDVTTGELLPPGEGTARLQELCERSPIYSGLRLTRDQLHERD